jgi:hypothetical protein
VTPHDLDPVLSLRALQCVRLGLYGTRHYDYEPSAVLRAMLQAWPALRTLAVIPAYGLREVPLEVFVDMVRGRPSLRDVTGDIGIGCSPRSRVPTMHSGERFPFVKNLRIYVHATIDPSVERAPLVHFLMHAFPGINFAKRMTVFGNDPRSVTARLVAEANGDPSCRSGGMWDLDQFRECERALRSETASL